jgi:hypothetical protein
MTATTDLTDYPFDELVKALIQRYPSRHMPEVAPTERESMDLRFPDGHPHPDWCHRRHSLDPAGYFHIYTGKSSSGMMPIGAGPGRVRPLCRSAVDDSRPRPHS